MVEKYKLLENIGNNLDGKHMIYSALKTRGGVYILASLLKMCGLSVLVYSGDIGSDAERARILNSFNSSKHNLRGEEFKVILLTEAGGEGLNLQEASVVLFMDPLWNNAGEQQAIDRVHRIGQKRRVDVIRYVTKGTVEELVVKLQRKKQVHTDAILGDPRKFKGLCIEDLKLFFKYKK